MISVVAGIDGSQTSWRAFSLALGLCFREQGSLHCCYVSHTPTAAEMAVFAVPVPPPVVLDDGGELEQQVVGELRQAGVKGDFVCRNGEVARELELLAETWRADMIVVGRSRHPALHLGGVPRRLLAMGRRPVLVVP